MAQEVEASIRQPQGDTGAAAASVDAPPAAPAEAGAELGEAIEVPRADPLKLIKQAEVPVLSSEKEDGPARPLEFLVQARRASILATHRLFYLLRAA